MNVERGMRGIPRQIFKSVALLFCMIFIHCAGCKNTEYAPNLTREGFDSVTMGASVDEVLDLVGEPIYIYAYPIPITYSKGEIIDIQTVRSGNERLGGREVDFHYSRQINGSRNYSEVVIRFQKGTVFDKDWGEVGD